VLQAGVRGQDVVVVVVVVRLVGQGVIFGHCGGSRNEGCGAVFVWDGCEGFATLLREGRGSRIVNI
jgi:hypothetical protein